MASQFEKYLADNPAERDKPPDVVLEELYGTSGVQESFEVYAEKVLRDPDRPLGRVPYKPFAEREPQPPTTEPDEQSTNPVDKPRGFKERIVEGYKSGAGPTPPPKEPLRQYGPAGAVADMTSNVVEGVPRVIGGAIGALGGVVTGLAEPVIGKSQSDKLQRDWKPGVDTAMVVGGIAPARQIPRVPLRESLSRSHRNFSEAMRHTDEMVQLLEADLKVARDIGDAERVGAIEAEINRMKEFKQKVDVGPPKEGDPIMSRMVPTPEGPQSALINTFDHYYMIMKDKFHPYNKAVKEATGSFAGKHLLPEKFDPYVLARLTAGVDGQTEHFIKWGTFDYGTAEAGVTGQGLRQILAPVSKNQADLASALRYAIAKRVLEKEGQSIMTGVDIDFARKVVDSVETMAASVKPTDKASLAHWQMANNIVNSQRGLVGYNAALVKYLVDAGVIAEETAERFQSMNLDYIPFYRLLDETQRSGGPRGGQSSMNLVKIMRGSDKEILNPLESMIGNTYAFLKVAAQNRARAALTQMAEHYDMPHIAERILTFSKEVTAEQKAAKSELVTFLEENGLAPEAGETLSVLQPKVWRQSGNEIVVMRNGQREVWRVDPAIAEATRNMNASSVNALANIAAVPARLLRGGATRSPDYPFMNMFKDQFNAIISSQYGYGPWDLFRSLFDVTDEIGKNGNMFNPGKGYLEFLRAGGANATVVAMDEMRIEMARQKLVGRTPGEYAKLSYEVPLGVMQFFSNMSENATRVAGYLNARAEGASPFAAAYEARELTLDFARMGSQMQAYNMITAFANAQMEGVDRIARAFASDPVRAPMIALAGITVPSVLLWINNHQDPRYKNKASYEKNNQWHFFQTDWQALPKEVGADQSWKPLPDDMDDADVKRQAKLYPVRKKDGKWQFNDGVLANYYNAFPIRLKEDGSWEADMGKSIKIGKPFELGVTFGTSIERMLDVWWDKDPDGARGFVNAFLQAFGPNIVPTVLNTPMEIVSDRNFFLDRNLTPRALKDELPAYRYNEYTSEAAKKIGKALQSMPGIEGVEFATPIAVDHLVRGWGGTLGQYVLNLTDYALRQAGVVEPSRHATTTAADWPMIRRIVSRNLGPAHEPVSLFYEKHIKIKQTEASRAKLGRQGQEDEAENLAREGTYTKLEEYSRALTNLSKEIAAIQRMPLRDPNNPQSRGWTADEKRNMIDQNYMAMNVIAKQGMRLIEDTEKGARKAAPARKSPQQRTALEGKDERYVMFSNLNNEAQKLRLARMPLPDQFEYAQYGRKATQEYYAQKLRAMSAEEREEVLAKLPPHARQFWGGLPDEWGSKKSRAPTAPPPPAYDVGPMIKNKPQDEFQRRLDDAKRSQ